MTLAEHDGATVLTARPSTSTLVDWSVAQRVAEWVLARRPVAPTYRADALQAEFEELTAQAEELVSRATGLTSPAGPARAKVTDRSGWVAANVASMQRLLAPTLGKLEDRRSTQKSLLSALPKWVPNSLANASKSASGAQLGLVLAWMSTRVLGQYDLLLTEDLPEEQDLVYFVGPNIVDLEARFGFPSREFRLWIALHEVTHRFQFTAVPWLRDHFLTLVDQGLEPMVADPRNMAETIKRVAEDLRAGRSPLDESGIIGLVATPEQLEALQRIQALMSLLEGHGDVTMDRAGAEVIEGAARFSWVLHERRQQVRGFAKVLQRLLGLEAKLRQYAEGEHFVNVVEEAGGAELFSRVWRGPEWLPSLAEIRDPGVWISRVSPGPAVAG